MRKILKSRLFFFLLGVLVTITSTVFAYTYFAVDIGYTPVDTTWNVENVSQALNDIHSHIHMKTGEAFLIAAASSSGGMYLYHNYNPYGATYQRYHLDFSDIRSFRFTYELSTTNPNYQLLRFSGSGVSYSTSTSVTNVEVVVNGASSVNFDWNLANLNTGYFKVLSYVTMEGVTYNLS